VQPPAAVRGHIPWTTVDLSLRAGRSIWVATSRPDGRAMVAPVWYWWDGDAAPPLLYFITARATQKARNLAANDWVEAHLGDGDDVVMVRGRVSVVVDQAEGARVDEAYRERYVDPYSGTRASIHDNPQDDLYRLAALRVIAWSYGTVGTWTEWRFE
jgi:nitroimidazol reductase NimA-like FMN-containing flavoprotein (pyridoxamine 5'-phosphate oxidase superfamily)